MLINLSKKYPAIITVIPLVVGITVSYLTGINLSLFPDWIFIVILIILASFIFLLYNKKAKSELYLFPYLLVIIFFGIFSFQYSFYKKSINNISHKVKQSPQNIILKGTITEKPEVKDDRIRLLLDVHSVNDSLYNGTVFASIYKNKFKDEFRRELFYGDVIELKCKLQELPSQRNPGEFNYGEYLRLHGIDASASAFGYENLTISGYEDQNVFMEWIIYPIKDYSVKTIDSLIGSKEGEYLKGLLLGERSNIPQSMKEDFVNAGVAHIVAVSGLNVAYVSLIIWGILLFFPIKHQYKIFITIAFLLFYMVLTGSSPSIVRAVIMASIFFIAQLAERKPNSYNILAFAALVILAIDPKQLFDSGFILSFSALLSLIIIYPILDRWIKKLRWYKNLNNSKYSVKVLKAIISLFTGTLAAQLGTLPITAIMFKKISIVSLAANLFAIPLSNISLALGFIMVLLSPVSHWLASVFASLNNIMLYYQIKLIEICANFDFAFVQTYFVDAMLFITYYIVLILLLTMSVKNIFNRVVFVILIFLNYWIWKDASAITNEAELTFLYSGNYNSTLIKMPQGTSVLINCGGSSDKNNSAQRNIIPYLRSKGINEIDLLVLNSLDKNEFRNLLYFVSSFPVKKIIVPKYYNVIFSDKSIAGNFRSTEIEFITISKIINKNGNFRLFLYYDSFNAGKSMMTQFIYGDQSFVFNDAQEPEENIFNIAALSNNGLNLQALRVAGSGSFYSAPPMLLAEYEPEYVIVGETLTSRKKIYSEIFDAVLNNFNYNLFNVSKDGAVILRTNGELTRRILWK